MSTKIHTVESVWQEYEKMLGYNESISLDDTVKTNENFFIGKQWEGVQSNGLPTPVFNILKRVTLFTVASIGSDNLKLKATPFASAHASGLKRAAGVVNDEFESLFEANKLIGKLRELLRNAAVDGDGATYTYWDSEAETGQPTRGAIVTEIIENTRIGFGNESDRNVQSQPYILIKRRELTDKLQERAKRLGCEAWEEINEDSDEQRGDSYKDVSGKTTVILRLWKENGSVWGLETTRDILVREPWELGLTLYPVTWLNWDYVQDCYHGQAMITGLIPNQVFINKLFAMSMISLMTTAYPKVIYDKTRIPKWDNGVGRAIAVNGGGVDGAARLLGPATISPQIAQFIDLAVNMTQANLGATSVALGDAKPDNTSAIIALQRAASTPHELTRQNLYATIEDIGRIYLDFMGGFYGTRTVAVDAPDEKELDPAVLELAGEYLELDDAGKFYAAFDFASLRSIPMSLKLDVGASSYWSEIAATQTLDNLLVAGHIDMIDYLERIPEGYISDKQGLIDTIRKKQDALDAQAAQGAGAPAPDLLQQMQMMM